MKQIIWASANKPTDNQLKSLKEMGKVLFLRDENPELYNKMCNISEDTNLSDLAWELIEFAKNRIVVQPAGNPAFYYQLGETIGWENGSFYAGNGGALTPIIKFI